jgi:hypothetical protein
MFRDSCSVCHAVSLHPSAASRLSAARSGVLYCAATNVATRAPTRTFSPGADVVLACVQRATTTHLRIHAAIQGPSHLPTRTRSSLVLLLSLPCRAQRATSIQCWQVSSQLTHYPRKFPWSSTCSECPVLLQRFCSGWGSTSVSLSV